MSHSGVLGPRLSPGVFFIGALCLAGRPPPRDSTARPCLPDTTRPPRAPGPPSRGTRSPLVGRGPPRRPTRGRWLRRCDGPRRRTPPPMPCRPRRGSRAPHGSARPCGRRRGTSASGPRRRTTSGTSAGGVRAAFPSRRSRGSFSSKTWASGCVVVTGDRRELLQEVFCSTEEVLGVLNEVGTWAMKIAYRVWHK